MRGLPRTRAFVLLLAFSSLSVLFQNCSSSSLGVAFKAATGIQAGGSSTSQSSTAAASGNGQGYDGATVAIYVSGTKPGVTCPDGTQINGKLQVIDSQNAVALRVNCVDIAPQPLSPGDFQVVPGISKYVIYQSAVFESGCENSATHNANLVCLPTTPLPASLAVSVVVSADSGGGNTKAQFVSGPYSSQSFSVVLASSVYAGKDSHGNNFNLTTNVSATSATVSVKPASSGSSKITVAPLTMTCYQ